MPTAPRDDSDNGWTLSLSFPDHIQQVKPIAAVAKSLQLCPTLCDPIDDSPPGSPVPGILQSSCLGFSRQEDWSGLPFPSPMHESESEVAQSYLTLYDPIDGSPPGSPVPGILQVRTLEWVAISFSNA